MIQLCSESPVKIAGKKLKIAGKKLKIAGLFFLPAILLC